MRRIGVAAFVLLSTPAAAEPLVVGGSLGPHFYSEDSALGYIDKAPFHPSLEGSMTFNGRVSYHFAFLPKWVEPEAELSLSGPKTSPTGAAPVSVFWAEPRIQIRFDVMRMRHPERPIQPFALAGFGTPIALSSASNTFDNGIVASGYVGGGLLFDTQKNFLLRLDARVVFVPGFDSFATPELDVILGIDIPLGRLPGHTATGRLVGDESAVADQDLDGIVDAKDACPDRAEDKDGFEDADGCPEIDNDMDHVLDVADKCPDTPEVWNGFDDDDGCPDTLPADLDTLRGTIEGLTYGEADTKVHSGAQRALKKIAKTLEAHPSVRLVVIGHTDDREALRMIKVKPKKDDPPPDVAGLSSDLSKMRAQAVKDALVKEGIADSRIDIIGRAADEPVADNDKPRGRAGNRRVEIKLFVATP